MRDYLEIDEVKALEVLDSRGNPTVQVEVVAGKQSKAQLKLKQDFYALLKKGDNQQISIKYDIKNNIKAPAKSGDKVGVAIVVNQGKIIGEVDVVLCDDILNQTFGDIVYKIVNNWSI